jgi:hypothetical protein
MKLNLYGKELAAIDSSKFKAVNSKDRNFNAKKLESRIARINAKIDEYLHDLEDSDSAEDVAAGEKSSEEIMQIIAELAARKERYQSYAEELMQTGEGQKSLTDPDSRLMMNNGRLDVCYNIHTAVDAKNKLIIEFDITNCTADDNQITAMVEKATDILETDKLTAVVDAGYDSVQDIVACMEQGNDIHVAGTDFDICIPDQEQFGTEILSQKDGRCVYFPDRNIALCPMGKVLYPSFYKNATGFGVFSNLKACKHCACKCTKEARGRRYHVPMKDSDFSKVFDDAALFVKQIRIAPNKKLIRQRKAIVEHPFGTVKRNMEAGYCLTKGLQNVNGEFSLTFLAYNLKRAINILGTKGLMECLS